MRKSVTVLLVVCMIIVAFQAWGAESKTASQTIDVTKMTCKEMMAGNDLDRSVVAAYFHGFLAGKSNKAIVDVDAASVISDKARDYCLSNPASTVMDAFTKSGK